MNITITPACLSGSIEAIPSKSMAHRLLICAAFADEETKISCPRLSRDITATAECLNALGAEIKYENGCFYVKPITFVKENAEMDCGESGSTLRFLLPVVCALGTDVSIKMHGRLPERPLSPLWEELETHGSVLNRPESDTISVGGKLVGGQFSLAANVSSQFISGLLFALPLLGEDSSIELVGNIESAGYIRMTQDALKIFGIETEMSGNIFDIPSDAVYRTPGKLEVEGDWSNAAFWYVANAIGGKIDISGLDSTSAQGDRAVTDAVKTIASGDCEIDVKDIPDLVPILSVLASVSKGRTEFVNAGRLRIKESDRLRTVCDMLRNLGGDCTETENGLIINGRKKLKGGTVDSANDHRIAMSAAIAALACEGEVTVLGAEATQKSYPDFWEDYKMLGGKIK